jgi:hypothetical protein
MQHLLTLCFIVMLISCGKSSEDSSYPEPTPQPQPQPGNNSAAEFSSSIKPLLTKNCAGAGCHTSGAARDAIIQTSTNFIASKAAAEIQGGQMPPPASPKAAAFSATDKSTILAFIAKYK